MYFLSRRRRQTSGALVTGVQTVDPPIYRDPLPGRGRDGQRLVAAERDELPADAVETHHLAEVNVDEPAVQRNLAARDARRDRRMGAQVRELNDDILEAGGADEAGIVEARIARPHDMFGGVAVAQPCGDLGHAFHHVRSEEHTSELQSLMRISYAVF